MKTFENNLTELVALNIAKLLRANDWKASRLAMELNTTEGTISKKLSGSIKISLNDLSEYANALSKMARENGKPSISVIDLLTYPERWQKVQDADQQAEPIEAVLQIKLQKSKKDQVLRLIFGDNDIELLNH